MVLTLILTQTKFFHGLWVWFLCRWVFYLELQLELYAWQLPATKKTNISMILLTGSMMTASELSETIKRTSDNLFMTLKWASDKNLISWKAEELIYDPICYLSQLILFKKYWHTIVYETSIELKSLSPLPFITLLFLPVYFIKSCQYFDRDILLEFLSVLARKVKVGLT